MTSPTEPAAPSVAPLDGAAFADLMTRLAPFEPGPHIAVAVSGGADSLALALLAHDWARARGGRITALTVDHRLRPAAAAEAAQVASWLAARGIGHEILVRDGPVLLGDVQAQARSARYRLLEDWCEAAGVLHLLTAHHREDQAETFLLRLGRGSGLDGLAGMAAIAERAQCRLLRPLLAVPRARLAATLEAAGQGWIEDPSNADSAYARVRLRQADGFLAAEGLTAERLAATAGRLSRARAALEEGVAALLARAVTIDPAGFALLDAPRLGAAPEELGLRGLAALLAAVSGAEFPPRLDALERLYRDLPAGLAGGRTLGGCRLVPRRGRILVFREPVAMAAPVPARPGTTARWDGRFSVAMPAAAPDGLTLGALGSDAPAAKRGVCRKIPGMVRPTLPALRDFAGLVAVPHLNYHRAGNDMSVPAPLAFCFRPIRPLSGGGFTVV